MNRAGAATIRLAVVAAATWAAALVSILLPQWALTLAASAWLLVVAAAIMALLRGTVSAFVLAVLLPAVVASHVAVLQQGRTDATEAALAQRLTAVLTVTTKVEPAWPGAWRFSGDATFTVPGIDAQHRAPVRVVFTGDRPEQLDLGATVEVSASAERAHQGERAVVVLRGSEPPEIIHPPPSVLGVAADLRHGFATAAARFPGAGAALLPGLAVGDTAAVGERLDADMRVANLSHITAVSGANCAIVVGAVYLLAGLCRAPRAARVVLALIALTGFVVLVTPEASVVRAGAMAALGMLAVLLGRARSGLALLSVAVALLLVIDPWLATAIGFVLSVAATTALLALAEPIASRLAPWTGRTVALALAVPVAAQLVCAPIIVLLTPAVSVYGVVANVLCAPAATFATVAGLIACLTAGIPGLGTICTAIAWVPAQWIASTAEVTARLPSAQLPWAEGAVGVALLGGVSVLVIVLLVRTRDGPLRAGAVVLVAALVGVVVGSIGVRAVVVPALVPDDWRVAACDVGQGDALLLRSAGEVVLVDTGPDPALLQACLDALGVGRIALLVLTHFDADHAGGLEAVLGRTGRVLHGPVPTGDQQRLALLVESGAVPMAAAIGMTGTVGDAAWRVLWPGDDLAPGNDASVVIEIGGGGVPTSILLGDLSEAAQQRMQAAVVLHPPYAIVKVAHHGSADQSPRLYATLQPQVALITVGVENDYGHPRADTLALLDRVGAVTARTDTDGLIVIGSDDAGALTLWRQLATGSGETDQGE